MDFRILGPLEVHRDVGPLTLGAAKQRALLAILLLHANEVVSSDRLVDELWGARPPDTAAYQPRRQVLVDLAACCESLAGELAGSELVGAPWVVPGEGPRRRLTRCGHVAQAVAGERLKPPEGRAPLASVLAGY